MFFKCGNVFSDVLIEDFNLHEGVLELRLLQSLSLLPVGDKLEKTCIGMSSLV